MGRIMQTTKFLAAGLVLTSVMCSTSNATTILYTQNFENPNPGTFENAAYSGPDASWNSVNNLYGGQPAGFLFGQQYTVETLRVGGNQAWNGLGFQDPQAQAGRYVISMLSSANDDRLGLSFNVGAYKFLNFQLDVSSIDLNFWGGPFVPNGGLAPSFRISLYDNPTGVTGIGGGTLLDSVDVTGLLSADKYKFNWSNHIVALDATGNTNGNVTLQIDELQGGYAALDNFVIAASDTVGDVGTVPEPVTLALFGLGLVGLGAARRRSI